ncbi:MAG TPA: hypothetical protein VFW19_17620 [Allosphingosinicella sp.]|nr:hypothetical protein [Allosphingosinicella sp.]
MAEEPRSYTGAHLKPLLKGPLAEVAAKPKRKARVSAAAREREAAE